MDELELLINEITDLTGTVIGAVVLTLESIISEVAEELSVFVWNVAWGIEWMVYELADMLYEAGLVEWWDVDNLVRVLSNYLYNIAQDVAIRINGFVVSLNNMLNSLLVAVNNQLDNIDEQVTEDYRQRMFLIYGRISELSIAINAPPSYLEEAIQNAKIFALSVSSSLGLSWWDFQISWDIGLTNLLNHINNSVPAYRANPQQIKTDLEIAIIRPAYDLKIEAQRRQTEDLTSIIQTADTLALDVADNYLLILEAEETIETLMELTIEPALNQITEDVENWRRHTYQPAIDLIRGLLAFLATDISAHRGLIADLANRFNYAGDILKRIDILPDTERISQESKIAEVTSRVFNRNAMAWRNFVAAELE